MFQSRRIRAGVMAVVNQRINEAQAEYDTGVKELEATHRQELQNLKAKLVSDKDGLAKRLVDRVLGGVFSKTE